MAYCIRRHCNLWKRIVYLIKSQSTQADLANYQSYNRSNRLASTHSSVKLPGIVNDPIPQADQLPEPEPSNLLATPPASDPTTSTSFEDSGQVVPMKRSFGCARLRCYDIYLKKKMTREINLTLAAYSGDSNPIGWFSDRVWVTTYSTLLYFYFLIKLNQILIINIII